MPQHIENNIPQIIEQAAKSPLGIFALMIVAVSIIGFYFFRRSSETIKIFIFLVMFAGVACFGVAISREASAMRPKSSDTVPAISDAALPAPAKTPSEPSNKSSTLPTVNQQNQQQTNQNGTAIQIGNARDINIAPSPKP